VLCRAELCGVNAVSVYVYSVFIVGSEWRWA